MLGRNLLILIVFVLAAGLAAGAWWLVRTPAVEASRVESILPTPVQAPADPSPGSDTNRTDATLEGITSDPSAIPTTVVFPLQFDLELVASAVTPTAEGVHRLGSDATARITGSVNGAGGQGLRAEIAFVAGSNEGRLLRSDRDGRFGANDLYPGLSIVRMTAPGTPGTMREVLLRKDRETQHNIGFGRPAYVTGTVKDFAGDPVGGAKVTLDGQETVTDDQGEFVFAAVAGGDTFVIVEKQGSAAVRQSLTLVSGASIEKGALSFVLRKPARLEITLEDRINVDGQALVYVLPDPMDAARDFPWHRINPIRVYPGGTVVVEDLPARRVSVRAFHAGAVAKPLSRSLTLQENAAEHLSLHLEPAPVLVGVVTQDGRPAAGAEVVLEAPERAQAMLTVLGESNYLDLEREVMPDFPPAVQRVKTNAGGEFVLSSCENVTPLRYLHARSADGQRSAWKLLRGGETRVDLALEPAQGEARIVVEMDGRTQGLPVEVVVNGTPRDPQVLPAHQDLEIAGLAPGSWKLTARWNGEPLVTSMPIDLHGEATVELVLPEGAIVGQDEDTRRRSGKEAEKRSGK